MSEVEQQGRAILAGTAGVLVHADEAPGPCLRCGGPMHVRKTFVRKGVTIAHGAVRVSETVHVCARGCTTPGIDGKRSRAVITRQAEVAELLLPRSTVGYDIMTFVGLQRFVHYRQREEIRSSLRQQYGITLSSGTISQLCRRFLQYLEALHKARAPDLRQALANGGGWPLHIDATGEDGRGTLFVAYEGWRGWVLGSWKIPTERADAILPRLRAVELLFGAPCSVMRDLGKAVTEAARDFVGSRAIPVFGCHLHFLKDIGNDLLRAANDSLRDHFRRFEVLARLRTLTRDLGRSLGTDIEHARSELRDWLGGADERFLMPAGNAGLAVVRALGQWVLDHPADGSDAGFPFDQPLLDLHRRCLCACRAVESLLDKPYEDPRVHKALERLHRIVEPVRSDLPFQAPVRTLETRARLFNELRDSLRLDAKRPSNRPVTGDDQQKMVELSEVKKAVEELQASLMKRRPARGPAQNMREAIDVILVHLERHGPSLWGHLISLPPAAGGGTRLVERTNVLLESFFHHLKHGERRRSGRKILTQDLEHLPASAVLACNLTKPDYVATLCGTLDGLPRAFAKLDAADRSTSLPVRLAADTAAAGDDDADIVSSSLPNIDRDIVRTSALKQRVLDEARRRAPRRSGLDRTG